MAILQKILYPQTYLREIFNTPSTMLDQHLLEVSAWFYGVMLSNPVEHNRGVKRPGQSSFVRDIFAPGGYSEVAKPVGGNATVRLEISKRYISIIQYISDYCRDDPNSKKPGQLSGFGGIAGWPFNFHAQENCWFTNNVYVYHKENLTRVKARVCGFKGEFSPEMWKCYRHGLGHILPFAKIEHFRSLEDFLERGRRVIDVCGSDWRLITEQVCSHNWGGFEFGELGYNPCEIQGIPGYSGGGRSLVISVEDAAEKQRLLRRHKELNNVQRCPKKIKKLIWERDDYKCSNPQCCGELVQKNSMNFDHYINYINDNRQDYDHIRQDASKHGWTIEHILPWNFFEKYVQDMTSSQRKEYNNSANLLTVCGSCNCDSRILGVKSFGEKMQMFADEKWVRGDGAGYKQIIAELSNIDFGRNINEYIKQQCSLFL